jgi:hypothetical protein
MALEELIDRYFAVWNAADAATRANLLASIWTADGIYTDPSVQAIGADALLDHIAGVRDRRPGAVWSLRGELDMHHDLVRFAWHVVDGSGAELRRGIDVVVLAEGGTRIGQVIGFFDPPTGAT